MSSPTNAPKTPTAATLLASVLRGNHCGRTTRQRLHLAGHRTTTIDHKDAVFANRTTLAIATALCPETLDAAGQAQATAVAHHIATILSHKKADEAAEILRRIVVNLKDPLNGALRSDVISGMIAPEALTAMREADLANPQIKARNAAEAHQRNRERNLEYLRAQEFPVSTMYKCPHCGSETTFADTRPTDQYKFWCSDDGAGTLVTCITCGHGWKE